MTCDILSLIIFVTFRINLSYAHSKTDLVARICGKVPVQDASSYIKYYANMADELLDDIYSKKFAIDDTGEPPNRLYVLAQCMDDLTKDECAFCFTQISNLISGCFPHTGGRVYFDGCFIRAENYSFYSEAVGPEDTRRCVKVVNKRKGYRVAVNKVIQEILVEAPASGGFAVSHETSGGVVAYGMGSCWKILDENLCSTCLSEAAQSALSCLPSVEGRALNAGCFLRYAATALDDHNGSEPEEMFSPITYIVGAVLISILAIGLGVGVGRIIYKRKNRQKMFEVVGDDLVMKEKLKLLQFKYATLDNATQKFNEERRLGRGGFGEVYKGTLRDGREIAIKRLFLTGKNHVPQICNEIEIISRAQHKNLVRFLGCCFTSMDSFLVYEYLPNKSLDLILFDPAKKKELDWKKRQVIITGTAEGLEYLHKYCQVQIIHRDIKASNILLDLKFRPKISDFGLARFQSRNQSVVNTAIAGTLGYMAPEYIAKGRLTEKVDVYSFGVLVIEIVTGATNNKYKPEATSYESQVTLAWKHFQLNTTHKIIDKSIEIEDIEAIKRVVQIGLLCTQESPNLRPSMTEVVQMLRKKDIELPVPSKPPFTDEHMELHT